MIRVFYLQKSGGFTWSKNPDNIIPADCDKMIWVDMQESDGSERKLIEKTFQVELFTPQEAAEIESSSRYFEDVNSIEANNTFIVYENRTYVPEQISFILWKEILFTIRNADVKSFAETVRKLKVVRNPGSIKATQIFLTLLETQIDLDADFIEYISKLTNSVSKQLLKEKIYKQELLLKITELQENTILARESIVDKQRLSSALLKSDLISAEGKDRLRIIFKDVSSILQHAEFSFERLEYLQNTFLGLVNIEQNTVIKIFTVVTVVFMPPTLIASIYGMNFDFMPELEWMAGYPFALVLMLISSLGFLWYFKRKKWL